MLVSFLFFFFKQKTAYEMRISDWSSTCALPTFRIVDRLKDMISVGGFKVYPSVIEARLYEHPAVKEAIVLGVPDPYLGETPKAFVTLEDGFDVSEIGRAHV